MKLKHIKDQIWQVSETIDSWPGDSVGIPIIIRFVLDEDSMELRYIKAWAWSCAVQDDESWMLRSWLEENESMILDLANIGPEE